MRNSLDVSGRRLTIACLAVAVAGGLAGCATTGAGVVGQGAAVPTITATASTGADQPTDTAATDTAASDTTSSETAASDTAGADTAGASSGAPATVTSVDTEDVATDPPAGGSASSAPSSSAAASSVPPDRPSPVVVTTTYAGVVRGSSAVEAGGFVDVIETDGTCTLVLRRGSTTREVSAPATPDPAGTSCGGLAVELSQLASGTWSGVLSYASPRSAGSADAVEVEVP